MRRLTTIALTLAASVALLAPAAADRVVFIDQGVIVEQGTPEQIFTAPVHRRTQDFVRQIAH